MKNNIIEGISLENFRVFKDKSNFELAPITILTGANSSGKSTLIKAQKLLKTFWEEENNSHNLDINRGNLSHQLGDYENVINDKNENNEIKITYSLKPIYVLGKLIVEVVFTKDEDSQLKNGKLKFFSIRRDKDNHLLFSILKEKESDEDFVRILREQESAKCFIDRLYFINTLFSEINVANSYAAAARKYVIRTKTEFKNGEIKEKNGYKGPYILSLSNGNTFVANTIVGGTPEMYEMLGDDIGYMEFFYEPEITDEFCNHIKVEKSLFNELNQQYDLFKLGESGSNSFFRDEPMFDFFNNIEVRGINEINYTIRQFHITDLEKYEYLPHLLELISKIPKEKYNEFEICFWDLLRIEYPVIDNIFTLDTFINFCGSFNTVHDFWDNGFDELERVKTYLIENVKVDFDSFLKKIEIERNKRSSDSKLSSKENIESYIKKIFTRKYFYKQTDFRRGYYYDDFQTMLNYLDDLFKALFSKEYIKNLGRIDNPKNGIKKYEILFENFGKLFSDIVNMCIKEAYSEMCFIDAVRASSQRLYSFDSGNSFNVFLRKFLDKKMNKKFLNKWINEFEIGDKIEFDLIRGVGTEIFIIKGDKKINIVDLGYGVTQLLPLLLNIIYALSIGNSCVVVEEPEANLHPKFQSKLADLFFDAYKQFGIHFIIETHSEYFIRKLQYLTAKGDTKPADTVIHYIGNPNATKREPEEEQVRTIHIKSNGQLTKPFESGFFDEADNLALLLLDYPLN